MSRTAQVQAAQQRSRASLGDALDRTGANPLRELLVVAVGTLLYAIWCAL